MTTRSNHQCPAPHSLADHLFDEAGHNLPERDPDQLDLPLGRRGRRAHRRRLSSTWRQPRTRLRRYTLRFSLPDGMVSRLVIVQCPLTGCILSYRLTSETSV